MTKLNIPERRKVLERRAKKIVPQPKYVIKGKREKNRRKTDLQMEYFVDRYSSRLVIVLLSIVLMSILDYNFTLIHISNGAIELNPIMDAAIKKGNGYFFVIKYALTVFGLLALCVYKNFFPMKRILLSILFLYVVLTIYHIASFYVYGVL